MARVLLAESDRRIREFIGGILADCGHAVATCADGAQARGWLATGAIDVVVTDLVLRRGPGAAFGRDCAAFGVPTITLSGREFRADQAVPDRPPFLEKPFRFADLQRVVDAVTRRSRSPRARAAATWSAA